MSQILLREKKERVKVGKMSPNGTTLKKVAYTMSRFPKLTETFILYEMLAMEEAGIQVELFPLLREKQDVQHREVERYLKKVHFHPFVSLPILLANLYYLFRKPLTYFKLIWEVFSGTFGSLNFFFGALGVFPKSVRFAYEMKRLGVEHLHAHFATHPVVAALIVKCLEGIPFSFTVHGSDLHVERRMLDKKVEACATAVAVSRFNKEVMVQECGEELRDKIHVIRCGVDQELFQCYDRSSHKGTFQILCVASFEEVKGHKYLVEACKLLEERGIDFVCHLVGYGPTREQVEKQISDLGLKNRFKVHGGLPRTEVLKLYEKADVFILPSVITKNGKKEGIPVVIMEAMSTCLPVVSSRMSGIPELVQDGETGILVEQRDAEGLANALQKLHDHPELRGEMGRAGRSFVQEHFDLKENAQKLIKLIQITTARSS
jgi:glycosyltransferase involved in cell wall biosynthesis